MKRGSMMKFRRAVLWVIAIVVSLGCTACTNNASSHPSASSARSSAASSVPPPPKVGQCRNTPARNLDPNDWVDQTPVVDCSKAHTLETVGVLKSAEKLTKAIATQLAASCETPAVEYLGISSPDVRTVKPVIYWPSAAQRAAGQNWLRCDVGVEATTHCCRQLATQTGSLRGDVGADPVRFQVCLDQLPDPARAQPLTSCKKPHRTEVLPTRLELDVARYPSAAALSMRGRSECAKLVADRKDAESLVITPVWQPRAEWSRGSLFGACWIHRTTGLMPPIK